MKSAAALFCLPLALLAVTGTGLQHDGVKKKKAHHKRKHGHAQEAQVSPAQSLYFMEQQRKKAQGLPQKKEPPPPLPPSQIKVGSNTSYGAFTHQLVDELRKRPLGRSSLEHFLKKVAQTAEFASAGEWVEFGCATGRTMSRIVQRRKELGVPRVVHGFDSFQGLPSTWRSATVGGVSFQEKWLHQGSFSRNGLPPFWDPSSVQWHIGWFNETAPAFAKDPLSLAVGNISFAHMDADIYSSTAQIFESLEHRLAPGAYLVFDDLIGYPEYQEHEMKALYEMLKRTGRTLNVIGFPGPLLFELPERVRFALQLQKGENQNLPQNALVQLL
mmetsp:Transcript_28348/g.80097  ORF Transcript_28348/g.80097 Transcript_28348/m.80097 type:complete len:329 (+) Transcript_28348:73-1059(+)